MNLQEMTWDLQSKSLARGLFEKKTKAYQNYHKQGMLKGS